MSPGLSQFFVESERLSDLVKQRYRGYLICALIGLLWILVSDQALLWLQVPEDILAMTVLQSAKGGLFVIVTAYVFFILGRDRARELQTAADSMVQMAAVASDTYDLIWSAGPDVQEFNVLYYSGVNEVHNAQTLLGKQAVHPDDLKGEWDAWAQAFIDKKPFRKIVRLKTGSDYRYYENRVYPILDNNGELVEWFGACRDVDDFIKAEESLQRNEKLWSLAEEAGGLGIWDWDVDRNSLHISEGMRRQHGSDIASPTALKAFISADDYPAVRKIMLAAKRDYTPFSVEYRINSPDGGYRWILNQGQAFAGKSSRRMVGISMDITRIKAAEQRYRELAYHDSLTDLPSRRCGEEFLSGVISEAGPDDQVAACILDIDYFGVINDTQGPAVGDLLLRAVAKRLSATLGRGEQLSRYSADVFLLVMPGVRPQTLQGRLQTLKLLFRRPFEISGDRLFISVTGGIAVYSRDAHNSQELLRAAQTALYRAKETSRGLIGEFDFTMLERTERFEAVRNCLRSAISEGEFQLHYQPQFDLHRGGLAGFEALLRWHSPTLGDVSPAEFIPVAERIGLIGDIDKYVLESIAKQLFAWRREGKAVAPVCFNLSPVCLERAGNAEYIRDTVYRYGLSPDDLVLEVTETAIIHDMRSVRENLTKLGDYGFPIAIDDFGTGYSSLENLQRFPINKVKIDKNFIQKIDHSESQANMTRGIIHMAHDLGLDVIAEGVETEEQVALLRYWGCDAVQGYFYARALPAEQAALHLNDISAA